MAGRKSAAARLLCTSSMASSAPYPWPIRMQALVAALRLVVAGMENTPATATLTGAQLHASVSLKEARAALALAEDE